MRQRVDKIETGDERQTDRRHVTDRRLYTVDVRQETEVVRPES